METDTVDRFENYTNSLDILKIKEIDYFDIIESFTKCKDVKT